MKRFLSIILSIVMIMAVMLPAFAESEVYSGGGKITVAKDTEKQIEFTGTFSGPFFVAFADQGQVNWSGMETGVKDFSFNLTPVDEVISKHPEVQFINFPGKPSFINTAVVQFTIPVNDAVSPSLYMIGDDGKIMKVPDVTVVGTSNKKFEFKTNELAATYILSSTDLDYEEAPAITDTTVPVEPTPTPPVETEVPVEDIEVPAETNPQTGVNDVVYVAMIFAGLIGLAIVCLNRKKL